MSAPAALVVFLAVAFGLPQSAAAQQVSTVASVEHPVMLVVDTSGSMDDNDGAGTRKIEGAQLALLDYLGTVEPGVSMGLRTYPDPAEGGCNPGVVKIPVGPVDPEDMSAKIRALEPGGDTPTAEAMRAAVEDIRGTNAARGSLVIVSDGESTCADPCAAAREIAAEGFDLDTITIGFRISADGREELECIANALDGRYLDIEESHELRDTLDRLGRPRIEVVLEGHAAREAVAGGDYVDITASVANTGEVEARDVIGQITLSAVGVDVRRPVSRLGNLAPQASRLVTWRVRVGPSLAGRPVRFTIVGRALNASVVGETTGELLPIAVTDGADAGDILKGPGEKLAILGDSYSAGQGADVYDAGTDSRANACHRSPLTYLIPAFGSANVLHHACSGAVTAHIAGPWTDNGEPPQLDGLKPAEIVKAVVMTIGGNDALFGKLAVSCLLALESCARRVYPGAPLDPGGSRSGDEFLEEQLGDDSGLRTVLGDAYRATHGELNDEDAVTRRGAVAPILVLGYPLPVPLKGRSCAPMGVTRYAQQTALGPRVRTTYWLTVGEIDYLTRFALRLNATVEEAVEDARRNDGVPVFYVPTPELSFLPRHTVCDAGASDSASEPFARSVFSGDGLTFGGNGLNGAGIDEQTLRELRAPSGPLDVLGTVRSYRAVWHVFQRSIQEIAHPNVKGYAAETLAILRWTRSRAARDAVAFTKAAKAAEDSQPLSWVASDLDLGRLAPGATPVLQGGTVYPLTLAGFAPGVPLRVVLRSTPRVLADIEADDRGRVDTNIAVPRGMQGGRHTLELTGLGADGSARTVQIVFEIKTPIRPSVVASMGAVSTGALLLGIFLTWASGHAFRRRRHLVDGR